MEGSSKAVSLDTKELFFLVAKFLEASPCQEAAKEIVRLCQVIVPKYNLFIQVLKAELGFHELLPKAKNWLGQERQLTFKETESRYSCVESRHLELICSKLLTLLQDHNYQSTSGLTSLLGAGTTSCIHNEEKAKKKSVLCSALDVSQRCKELFLNYQCQPKVNICNLVNGRQISTCFDTHVFQSPLLYERLNKQFMVLGHLAAVFCVLFDHTGRCIITGADDDLLKVWSSRTGQLVATLRGHSAEVTDLSLSCDNTMIASGSHDKSVRVWCAQSSAPIAVLTGHQSYITSVQFSPSADKEYRYLASTGKDGFLCFWQWLPDQETYSLTPIKFMEKNRMGDQTLCSSFSAGGKYFVTGGTDHILRVYICNPGPPVLVAELDGHKDRIMSIQFGNTGEGVFATGSCDATARIWRYSEGVWTSVILAVPPLELKNTDKPQVTMVSWEKTDKYLMTAFTPDCIIRVWDSNSGELIQRLKGHIGEVFVLEAHPTDPRLLMTAGHDGMVIIWDMLAAVILKTIKLEGEDGTHASVFDCKFSPDGLMCAAVDMNGHLSLLGFGATDDYDKNPRDQFFHTDYRPLMRDNHHYVVDEQSQLPPHLLPPPYLVDIDGHAHPIRYQEALLRLVRPVEQIKMEQCKEEVEDYDEYMKKRLERVKQESFGFRRAKHHVAGVGGGVSNAHGLNGFSNSGNALNGGESALGDGDVLNDCGGGDGMAENVMGGANGRCLDGISADSASLSPAQQNSPGPSPHKMDTTHSEAMDHSDIDNNVTSNLKTPPVPNGKGSSMPVMDSVLGNGSSHSLPENHYSNHDRGHESEDQTVEIADGGGRGEGNVEGGGGGERGVEEVVDVVDTEESRDGQNVQNMLSSLVYSLGLNELETKRIIALWHNRTVVPPLDPTQLGAELAKRELLFREEHESYVLETRRARLKSEQAPSSAADCPTGKGRSLRSGRTLPTSREGSGESRSPFEVESSEEEESAGETEAMWYLDTDSTGSSDISDWTAEAGIKFSSPRKKKRRKSSESVLTNDDLMDKEDAGVLSHSGDEESGRSREKTKYKSRKKSYTALDYSAYAPPDWIKRTKFELSPYYPQVGDIVVYCFQGHQLYLKSVKEKKVYPIQKTKMPWQKYNLQPQEFCQVTNVRYLVGPPTLCSITLALLSPLSQSKEGNSSSTKDRIIFSFKYHDMNSVLDFLILEFLYKISVCTPWEEGKRFRSLIDGEFWFGVIKKKQPFSEDHPNSYWQCCNVLWDDGATDLLSPWDMEALPNPEETDNEEEEEEEAQSRISKLLSLQKEGTKEAWGGGNEPERILHGLEVISELEEAIMFLTPVDLESIPYYCTQVAFPTDLGTIKKRLQNGFYRRKRALLWELSQIAKNAIWFNEEDSLIVKHARVLVQTLWKFIESPEVTDPLNCYAPEPEGGEVEEEVDISISEEMVFVDTTDLPSPAAVISPVKKYKDSLRSSGSSGSGGGSGNTANEESSHSLPLWTVQARKILDEICNHRNSYPFLEPVDVIKYDDYLDYVRDPMDLGKVQKKLHNQEYSTTLDFVSDIRLIFRNALKYNMKGSKLHKLTTAFQSFFDKKVLSLQWQSSPYLTRRTQTRNLESSLNAAASATISTHSSVSSMDYNSSASNEDYSKEIPVVTLTQGYRQNLRSHLEKKATRDECYGECSEGEDSESIKSNSVSSCSGSTITTTTTTTITRTQRNTRSRHTHNKDSSSHFSMSETASPMNTEVSSMTLRTRSGSSRKRETDALETMRSEDSEEEEEEEDQNNDEESEEEYLGNRSLRKRKGRKRDGLKRQRVKRPVRTMAKRQKLLSYSDDEEEEEDVVCTTVTRTGRIVKPTVKYHNDLA